MLTNNQNYDLALVNVMPIDTIAGDRGFQLGLSSIATYSESKGYKAKIIIGHSVLLRISKLIQVNPDLLLGFYTTADNILDVKTVSKVIKSNFPNLKIILGGPEARVQARNLLSEKICDYICTGDGEECTYRLLEVLQNKLGIEEVPNLTYINDNQILTNKSSSSPFDLDIYPMPSREFFKNEHPVLGHIITAKGCMSRCTFCYEGLGNKIRRHSVGRTVEEVKYLQDQYGLKYLSFIDDTFTTDRRRIRKLNEIFKRDFNPHKDFIWFCEAKVTDIVKDPNIVQEMVDAGLARMQFGTESGDDLILQAYQKEISVEDIHQAVDICSKTNITSMFTNFIIGGAFETEETYRKTSELAVSIMRKMPGVIECAHTFLSPYKGTDIYINPEKYNLNLIDPDFETAASDSYIFAHSKTLKKERVLEMGDEFKTLLRSTKRELIKSLDRTVIKRQLLSYELGLSSNWQGYLCLDPIFHKYRELASYGYAEIKNFSDEDLYIHFPQRTFDLETLTGHHMNWDIRNQRFYFSDLEKKLIEYSSGKLSLKEIIDRIHSSQQNLQLSKSKIKNDIIIFYNQMNENFLLLHRKLG